MTAQIIDGKQLAANERKIIAAEIDKRIHKGLRAPGLAVILVGDDPASTIYVRNKQNACQDVGIKSVFHHLPESVTEAKLLALIDSLNKDTNIDGILVQLPLPEHIDTDHIIDSINPTKDVDGFHPYNLGRLAQKRPLLRPCTPYGVIAILDSIKQVYENRHAVVIGASNIVGRPMALELLMAGCTVTVCHRATMDIEPYVRQANILVSAVGKPGIVKGNWIKQDATVIDVGITRLPDGTLAGDVEYDTAHERAGWITPVPGGVGPMTVATLLKNTLLACSLQESK